MLESGTMEIRIAFRPGPVLSHHEMYEFQGELKEISDADLDNLCKEIIDTGFAFSPHLWKDPSDGFWKICDAHQRKKALLKLEERGWTISKFHTIEVLAKDFQEAKRRVLQGTSQYGKMTSQSLASFAQKAGISFEGLGTFRFPEAPLISVMGHLRLGSEESGDIDRAKEWEGMPEYVQEDKSGIQIMCHFNTLEDVKKFGEIIGQELSEKTRSIWYPEAERESGVDKSYVHEP